MNNPFEMHQQKDKMRSENKYKRKDVKIKVENQIRNNSITFKKRIQNLITPCIKGFSFGCSLPTHEKTDGVINFQVVANRHDNLFECTLRKFILCHDNS